MDSTVKEGRFQEEPEKESKKNFPRRSRKKHKRVMDANALQENLHSLGFTPSLAKLEKGKKVEKQQARSYDDRTKILRMTRRRGKNASERRRGIGKNERLTEIARLAAQYRPSNLVKLITLRKRNHAGEA